MEFRKVFTKEQGQIINKIVNNERIGLIADSSAGKTISTLIAISELKRLGKISKVILITSAMISHSTWQSEGQKWDEVKDLVIRKYSKDLDYDDVDIIIITFDTIGNLLKSDGYSRYYKEFNMLVIDESSNYKEKRARYSSIKNHLVNFKRRVLLTATPISNNPEKIYTQQYILDDGKLLGKSKLSFENRYFNNISRKQDVYNKYQIKSVSLYKELLKSLRSYWSYIRTPEVIEKNYKYIRIAMPKELRTIYDSEMNGEYISSDQCFNVFPISLDNYDSRIDLDLMHTKGIAPVATRLKQLVNGFYYDTSGIVNKKVVLSRFRIDKLKELIESVINNSNVLIFYNYTADYEMIKEIYPEAINLSSKSKDVIDKWNAGNIRILLANPKSCGHGLNLQNGGNIIIWYNLPYSSEIHLQANARLARKGQPRSYVDIYYIIVEDTIDVKIKKLLEDKKKLLTMTLAGLCV